MSEHNTIGPAKLPAEQPPDPLRHLTDRTLIERLNVAASHNAVWRPRMTKRLKESAAELTHLCTLIDHQVAEIERLKDVLHRDQTGLAHALNKVLTHVLGWSWIAQKEWGSYGYEEHTAETLQFEVKNLIDGASQIIDDALRTSGTLAHAECCGRSPVSPPAEGGMGVTRCTQCRTPMNDDLHCPNPHCVRNLSKKAPTMPTDAGQSCFVCSYCKNPLPAGYSCTNLQCTSPSAVIERLKQAESKITCLEQQLRNLTGGPHATPAKG